MSPNLKFVFIGMILEMAWSDAGGSVVGLTYMDDVGFEQRYRNVHECDPFYWHPLHLPEECADMYENLIRSRLPVRFAKRPSNQFLPVYVSPNAQSFGPIHYQSPGNPDYQTVIEEDEETVSRELTPYEEMLESVRKDVNNLPSVPSLMEMPNFGPVAVYQQPVSKISANMIKKVATTFIEFSDDKNKNKKQGRSRKSRRTHKWKELVNRVRHHERKGWKKLNNEDIVSLSQP